MQYSVSHAATAALFLPKMASEAISEYADPSSMQTYTFVTKSWLQACVVCIVNTCNCLSVMYCHMWIVLYAEGRRVSSIQPVVHVDVREG